MHPTLRNAALGALLLLASAAIATAVYRWVDDQGKVHYPDVVPERFRSNAKPVDAPANEPAVEQQREALERARVEKARASTPPARISSLPGASAPQASASQASRKRPIQIPNSETDCETWQRLYMESIECFGPYRTVRGATKPEAFAVCNVVQ